MPLAQIEGFTSEFKEPLQSYLHHVEGFLGLVESDGLGTLLLHIQLQVVLQVTTNPWTHTHTQHVKMAL